MKRFYRLAFLCMLCCVSRFAIAADEKTTWHGFERYDFLLDETTLSVTPFQSPAGEGDGVGNPGQGKRRCVLVVPKQFAQGRPWSWRGCYWNHEPQAEMELLKRGFCISYVTGSPGKEWEAWYEFVTKEHELSKKPAFIGMSRGGEYSYTWGVRYPDKVSCICADNPGSNAEVFSKLAGLAAEDVPTLHINGSIDPLLGKVSSRIEQIHRQNGGRISIVIKEGAGHHPHSLKNPKLIADFIEKSANEKPPETPAFVPQRATRTNYYSTENLYREFPDEKNHFTLRGPEFTPNYQRYEFSLPEVEGSISVVVPQKAVPGNPWLLRADFLENDAVIDRMLLAKGVAIVTGPVPYNADGPKLAHWNRIYQHLVKHGFSEKPILAGSGGAAGEALGWAIANPDKVSSVYMESPVLRFSYILNKQVLPELEPLAKAGVPIYGVYGINNHFLRDQAVELQERYEKLQGHIHMHVEEKGRYPNAPMHPEEIVDDLLKAISR